MNSSPEDQRSRQDSLRSGVSSLVHPDPVDRDINSNALYVSQVTDEQYAVEEALSDLGKGARDSATKTSLWRDPFFSDSL